MNTPCILVSSYADNIMDDLRGNDNNLVEKVGFALGTHYGSNYGQNRINKMAHNYDERLFITEVKQIIRAHYKLPLTHVIEFYKEVPESELFKKP